MSTPIDERDAPKYREEKDDTPTEDIFSGLDDDTYVNSGSGDGNHLKIDPSSASGDAPLRSASSAREQSSRLEDDLVLLEAERVASRSSREDKDGDQKSNSDRSRSRRRVDEFDEATNPLHERAALYNPPEAPSTSFSKFIKKLHHSSVLVRYFTYIVPLVLLLLIPLLLGLLVYPKANVGGVQLLWFAVWLEIVWLTLWAGRVVAKCIPAPLGIIASIFTNNSKKWRDLAKQLELPATLFFWWLGVEISFLPTMQNHHVHGSHNHDWEQTANKVLITIFVWAILNLVEKFIIQLIAINFHLRTYSDRIEINKFQIGSLAKLYAYSTTKIAEQDEDFEEKNESGGNSGARTPMLYAKQAQKSAKGALNKVGDVAGAVAADFTGRKTTKSSTHPHTVVLTLLGSTSGSQVLARRLYRTFVRDGFDTVFAGDLKEAFDTNEEAEAAFAMFDKDMNGDISMEELESVCMEVGRDRKSITASLKDLDSVVGRLDDVLSFLVFIIVVLVFLSLISSSTAGVLTSAGSAILALSWLFSVTGQEFLQSVIFVFVKHPFDVGDRVTIYGFTGSAGLGDDYYVKSISLLYTEFKKMAGHVVQAPNSYLNTLFILNMRRSGSIAECIPIVIKFGTTLDQIDALRLRLLEFVRSEKREYQTNILTEMRDVTENYSITVNVIFFYKSNLQNELVRLQRRNKFVCMLMLGLQELGIEGPRFNMPGADFKWPIHLSSQERSARNTDFPPSNNDGPVPAARVSDDSGALPEDSAVSSSAQRNPSILRKGADVAAMRARGASTSRKHVDFSLGASDMTEDVMGDVFEDRESSGIRPIIREANREATEQRIREEEEGRRSQSSSRPGRTSNLSGGSDREAEARRSGESQDVRSISSSTHRNRFFRHRGSVSGRSDLEKGQ